MKLHKLCFIYLSRISHIWMIYLIVDQHDNCTHEKNHSLMLLMWCVQSTNSKEAWPILPMFGSTTCSQVLPNTAHVHQLPH
jgi:hypothetical protein